MRFEKPFAVTAEPSRRSLRVAPKTETVFGGLRSAGRHSVSGSVSRQKKLQNILNCEITAPEKGTHRLPTFLHFPETALTISMSKTADTVETNEASRTANISSDRPSEDQKSEVQRRMEEVQTRLRKLRDANTKEFVCGDPLPSNAYLTARIPSKHDPNSQSSH